jgi:4-amino-4-deoxy-L-arabinose transferase-like glycosyltransferase
MRSIFAGFRKQAALVLLAALGLRLFFALACPHVGGDSTIYEAFAKNLLRHGIYSHLEPSGDTALRPTMIRMPGYPLMLAAVFAGAGENNETAVRIVQALLDTWTCILIALIAFELFNRNDRGRFYARWALVLSALCPFSASYSASILAEVPTTLLWTAAALYGLRALNRQTPRKDGFICGLLAGGATLFRPESGLLVPIFILVLIFAGRSLGAWKPVFVNSGLMVAGLVLVLLPWMLRNAWTLRAFQPLAPAYAQDQGERVQLGYLNWCRTWLWKYDDIVSYWFPLESTDLPTDFLPAGSYDNEAQRQKILDMIHLHNERGDNLDPKSDESFRAISRQRWIKHPLRCALMLPVLRSLAMWFTPRTEILNLEGTLVPLRRAWRNDPIDFSLTLFLFLLNIAYLALALWGIVAIFRRPEFLPSVSFWGCFALLGVIVIRTVFFAYFTFPEPRYVLEVYPFVIAFGAFAFQGGPSDLKRPAEFG